MPLRLWQVACRPTPLGSAHSRTPAEQVIATQRNPVTCVSTVKTPSQKNTDTATGDLPST